MKPTQVLNSPNLELFGQRKPFFAVPHTSIAIHDRLKTFEGPDCELYITNVSRRENSATFPMCPMRQPA